MPLITLRAQAGKSSPEDLLVEVKDGTFDYLLSSTAIEIRVSAYLERDWPMVAVKYSEIFLSDAQPLTFKIKQLTPGSRTRKDIVLPGPMQQGEQLTLQVFRRVPNAET